MSPNEKLLAGVLLAAIGSLAIATGVKGWTWFMILWSDAWSENFSLTTIRKWSISVGIIIWVFACVAFFSAAMGR